VRRRAPLVAGIGVAVAIGLWWTRHMWGPGPPSGNDVIGHLVRTEFGINLLADGRLDGWFPRFMTGYQLNLFYGPGYAWLVALVRLGSLGSLSTSGAVKVVVIASFVLLPAAVAFLARSLGLSRGAAGAAAVLSLAVSTPFGLGLQGLFVTGLVVHQVAAIFFCALFGGVARTIDEPRPRWVALTALSLAALLITHLFSVLVALVMLPLYLMLRSPEWRKLRSAIGRLAVGVAGGTALAAFWVVPFLAHGNLQGGSAGIRPPSLIQRLEAIARGDILFRMPLAPLIVLAVLGAAVAAIRGWQPAVALAVLPVGYLGVAYVVLAIDRKLGVPLVNRGLGYVGLVSVLPLAVALSAGLRRWVGVGGAVLAAAALVVLSQRSITDAAREFPEPRPQLRRAAEELARVVPDGARFTLEQNFPAEIGLTGVVHPDTWLVWASGRNGLVVFNPASSVSTVGFEGSGLGRKPPAASAASLSRAGVTHAVTTSDEAARALLGSSRFKVVWQEPPIRIFRVLQPHGQPDPASLLSTNGRGARAKLTSAAPEHPRISITMPRSMRADVAITWSPKWHARAGRFSVPVGRTSDGIITLQLPAGRYELALDFAGDGWDTLGRTVSLLGLAGGAAAVVRARRRRPTRRGRTRTSSREPPVGPPLHSRSAERPTGGWPETSGTT
jgi:hypothetical protein